jgi:hypothetical protein
MPAPKGEWVSACLRERRRLPPSLPFSFPLPLPPPSSLPLPSPSFQGPLMSPSSPPLPSSLPP